MNIFVTGSTGTIGQEVVRELLGRDIPFKVGVTSATKRPDGLESVVIDYGDAETLTQAFNGADTLFLLTPDAPQVKVWVENAAMAAKEAGVRHIVRSSGIGADVKSPYEIMKPTFRTCNARFGNKQTNFMPSLRHDTNLREQGH